MLGLEVASHQCWRRWWRRQWWWWWWGQGSRKMMQIMSDITTGRVKTRTQLKTLPCLSVSAPHGWATSVSYYSLWPWPLCHWPPGLTLQLWHTPFLLPSPLTQYFLLTSQQQRWTPWRLLKLCPVFLLPQIIQSFADNRDTQLFQWSGSGGRRMETNRGEFILQCHSSFSGICGRPLSFCYTNPGITLTIHTWTSPTA